MPRALGVLLLSVNCLAREWLLLYCIRHLGSPTMSCIRLGMFVDGLWYNMHCSLEAIYQKTSALSATCEISSLSAAFLTFDLSKHREQDS